MPLPSSLDIFGGTTSSGTSLLTSPDHSLDHRVLGSAANGIQNLLGTSAGGTSILKNFITGDFAARVNNETFGSPTITGGTANTMVLGTPAITGGTLNGVALGTGLLTKVGSDATGDIYYNNGGTFTRLGIGTNTQLLTTNGTTPSWVNKPTYVSFGTVISSDGTTASGSFVNLTGMLGTITIGTSGNLLLSFRGAIKNNGNDQNVNIGYNINGGSDVTAMTIDLSYTSTLRMGNVSFTTIVTGLSIGPGTVQMRWLTGGGTVTIRGNTMGYEMDLLAL